MVVKPFVTQTSNCILPDYVVAALLSNGQTGTDRRHQFRPAAMPISIDLDPVTDLPYVANPTYAMPPGYIARLRLRSVSDLGYMRVSIRATAPNNGEGFAKNLGGNQLPNAPHFTTSLVGEYTMPVSEDWAATLHSDFYWQSQSLARVFNDRPYDKLRGYSNVNLALILTSASGWQVMGYLKNVFDTTAITGDFLNSDDTGLTTNVFLTDPRLYGVRVTKNW